MTLFSTAILLDLFAKSIAVSKYLLRNVTPISFGITNDFKVVTHESTEESGSFNISVFYDYSIFVLGARSRWKI